MYKDEKADKIFCAWCTSDGTPHQLTDKKSPLVLGTGGEGKHKKDGLMTHDRSQVHRRVEAVRKSKTLKDPNGYGDNEDEQRKHQTHKAALQHSRPCCQTQTAVPALSTVVRAAGEEWCAHGWLL